MKRSRKTLLTVLIALAVLMAACGDDPADSASTTTAIDRGSPGSTSSGDETSDPASRLEGSLTVAAAASLRVAFEEVGEGFAAEHPEVDIAFNFDSSSTLATQIIEGAPVDVFASADQANMAKLADAGAVPGAPSLFAANELVIVTKPGNATGITGLADLVDAGVVSLCGEDVPCGRYAEEALDLAGVSIDESSVTRGQNAAATLTAVTEGDAVAAIVYATDAISAGGAVERVDIPSDHNVIAHYPIAAVVEVGDDDLAVAFVDYVLGPEAQAVLEEHGFLPAR